MDIISKFYIRISTFENLIQFSLSFNLVTEKLNKISEHFFEREREKYIYIKCENLTIVAVNYKIQYFANLTCVQVLAIYLVPSL